MEVVKPEIQLGMWGLWGESPDGGEMSREGAVFKPGWTQLGRVLLALAS